MFRLTDIRTYAVMPLNEECGMLEWVSNTIPLRNILIKAYERRDVKTYVSELLLNSASSTLLKPSITVHRNLQSARHCSGPGTSRIRKSLPRLGDAEIYPLRLPRMVLPNLARTDSLVCGKAGLCSHASRYEHGWLRSRVSASETSRTRNEL